MFINITTRHLSNLKAFSLYIHPHQIRSTNCKDTKQISYKNEQRVFLKGAMRYGGVLWLENRKSYKTIVDVYVFW
jgi:hypothetical protein